MTLANTAPLPMIFFRAFSCFSWLKKSLLRFCEEGEIGDSVMDFAAAPQDSQLGILCADRLEGQEFDIMINHITAPI